MFKFFRKKDISRRRVLDALAEVVHPELNKDVVLLGMIKDLHVDSRRVSFELQLPTPGGSWRYELLAQCRHVVENLGVRDVHATMTVKTASAPTRGKRALPNVANLICVASGKGGVGKSTISLQLALAFNRLGFRTGLLDCDIYGPSQSLLSGIGAVNPGVQPDKTIIPHKAHGLKVMSMGFLVAEDHTLALRGPMTHKLLQQFLFSVDWGTLDYLILDLPPGTGDVQLSLTQLAPISGSLIVTTPQDIALADVRKGVQMFRSVQIPVLGFVENMSYYKCGKCDKKHQIFPGQSQTIADEFQKPLMAEIPINPALGSKKDTSSPLDPIFEDLAMKTIKSIEKAASTDSVNRPAYGESVPPGWAQPGPGSFEV